MLQAFRGSLRDIASELRANLDLLRAAIQK
jgi:hypothetical protein